jgi:hypothetical protein
MAGAGYFFLLSSIQADSRAYPASYLLGTRGFFLGVKLLGHEADHTPLLCVEVKNGGTITLLPHAS